MEMDSLEERMKLYEGLEAKRCLIPLLPACARIDGKCFRGFTRDLERPFDPNFRTLMTEVTRHLVEETGARMGYTQSDEITLIWKAETFQSEIFFNSRIQKMVSVLASMTTARFNELLPTFLPQKQGQQALFDCRVWQVPNETEATNVLVWREQDATRNSIEMAARCQFSPKQTLGKTCDELQEMLFQKGINWNHYPPSFKRGTYVQRRKVRRRFTPQELDRLPEKHAARRDPELTFERTDLVVLAMPPITKVTNREAVIFAGAEPITGEVQDE